MAADSTTPRRLLRLWSLYGRMDLPWVARSPRSAVAWYVADLLVCGAVVAAAGYETGPSPKGVGDVLTIHMKYSPDRDRTIAGLRRISTPGLRVYRGANAVPRVLGGLGVAVLSTSHGLMTDREARKRKVGGEILCFVW